MTDVPGQAAMKQALQAYVDRINAGDAAGVGRPDAEPFAAWRSELHIEDQQRLRAV